ncbi:MULTISPECIES: helix-turn-helix domain-containing protein [unclassified Sphingobacterium]|uniref:helix-turn-helix domain-containing protein n=1 Tax=unclassified Sphingobacterium TaxID=2609468 RepID=UPI0025FECCC1|nr:MULTISPECIES: helix-turn-helix transcriptional regulator [unclassified Sphingobacterium]
MIQIKKHELSQAVSQRIDEILSLTRLPIQELANLAGINPRSLNGYHRGTLPITLESTLKICAVLSLDLDTFCDFNKKLSLKKQRFTPVTATKKQKPERPLDKEMDAIQLQQREKKEKDSILRDQIITFVHTSDYFLYPRTLSQMVLDFAKDYHLNVSEQRLQGILQRCIADGTIKRQTTPWDYGIGYYLPKRTWVYFKDEKDLLNDPKKLVGYNWIRNSIIV